MRYGILGSLELSDGERAVEIAGAKQRALLAMLLLNANRVVSTDRLIDALWDDQPPDTAVKALQVHVSQLRKLLGPGRLATRNPGYVLHVGDGELDLHEFESLVSRAREASPDEAAATLGEALALWRGPPLADFTFDRFAQAEIGRLEGLHFEAVEERFEAELALGHHSALTGELEALVADHPLRERLRAQLMLALYRSGRQAEALEAYQGMRTALVDELGIEPGRQLRELQQQILRQDWRLDLAVAVEPAGETPRGAFVGRKREFAELVGGLDDAFAGRGRLFLLAGEPGIGKSRLAEELIVQARARGARVLVGRCWEAGGAPAYWPWVQSLRTYVRESDTAALRSQLGAGAVDLGQIVPELRQHFPDLPEPPSLESEGARFRLFDATAEFLRNASADRPILLVLDDLHAADTPSLLLLQFLARELGSSRMLLLAAYRDVDPVPARPLAEMLAEVAREPVTRRLSLGGLSERDVAEYVDLAASEIASPELVAGLHEETEGNPLFVGETVRLLALEGLRRESTGARISIPQGVRDVIARRLTHLSDECNRVLVLASVLGREFALDALARVGGVSEDQLLETLDEAMAARVVSDVPGGHGRLRFAHVLIRDTLYDGLTTARRVRLHRSAVEALETLYGDEPGPHLAELAHHAIAGSDFEKGLLYARRAGGRALALLAYEEAARLYEVALNAIDFSHPPDGTTRCELLLALGDAQTLAGEGTAARETFLLAAEITRNARSPEHLARAALGYSGRDLWAPRAEGEPMIVPLLQEALAGCGDGDSVLRARLLARLASALRGAVDREQPASLAHEAVEMAVRIGDRSTLLYALGSRLVATKGPEKITESMGDGVEFVTLAEELGELEFAFSGHEHLLCAAWTLGDRSAMAAEVEAMTRLALGLRQPAKEWCVAAYHAMSALSEGRLEAAEELIEKAFRVGEHAESWIAVSSYRLQTFVLRMLRGDLESYEEVLRRSLEEYRGYRIFECVRAYACSRLGRESEAREAFESIAAEDFGELSRDEDWLVNMCLLSEVCVYVGDASRAATLYRLLSPFSTLNAFAQPEIDLGSVARSLGCLAAELSRFEEAESHFEAALEMNARMGARPWLAHTQHDYARLLLRRGEPGDAEKARSLLGNARAAYRELGMEGYAASAGALLEAYA